MRDVVHDDFATYIHHIQKFSQASSLINCLQKKKMRANF